MKKTNLLLIFSAILFSGLFYQQVPGINFPLLSLIVSIAILINNPQKLKERCWWYYCGCAVITGLGVFTTNSALSIFACIMSLTLFSSKSVNAKNSVLLSWLFGAFSLISAPVFWLVELIEPKEENENLKTKKNWKIFGSIIISALAVIVFFNLYRQSNPLFDRFTRFINFNWFSFGWILFTFFGFVVLRGLLRSRQIELLSQEEINARKDILKSQAADSENSSQNLRIAGWILFSTLNLMLLFLNALDINNIYIAKELPAGITLSDFVHSAVWNTVISIAIAISVIILIFKGPLNFNRKGKKLKWLVYFWILQSLLVVLNTLVRNYWYIQEYQLTYLRVSVFVFLLLCFFGLVFTYFKIVRRKSAWQLVVMNIELWFGLLVFSSLINWDQLITRYNIEHATSNKPVDIHYLLKLSDAALPDLIALRSSISFNTSDNRKLDYKIQTCYKKIRFRQWQSFNLRSHQNMQAFNSINLKP